MYNSSNMNTYMIVYRLFIINSFKRFSKIRVRNIISINLKYAHIKCQKYYSWKVKFLKKWIYSLNKLHVFTRVTCARIIHRVSSMANYKTRSRLTIRNRFYRFTSIYLWACVSIGISSSIYDWSRALVRISFQGVASKAILLGVVEPKSRQRE